VLLARSRQIALLLQDRAKVGMRGPRNPDESLRPGYKPCRPDPVCQLLPGDAEMNQPSKDCGATSTSFEQCLTAA